MRRYFYHFFLWIIDLVFSSLRVSISFLKKSLIKKIKKIPLIIPVLYKIFHQIKKDFDNLLAWWTKS